ncbi:aldolase [beta proteobacterium AAP99]|nr:aldolase [beta proteobacterium AAP99]
MHPSAALFAGDKPPVILPACDHYAGNLRFAQKALALQGEMGPLFDITLDLEDGAAVGEEAALAETFGHLAASAENLHDRVGLRVHAPHHPHFIDDLRIALPAAQGRLAYVMVPKVGSANDVANAAEAIERISAEAALPAPSVHVLIETHGALREVFRIAAHPKVQSLSLGLMDFVSAHHGAIPAAAMRSPGQFDHPLVVRAKAEIAAACHAYGKVPSHNVTTEFRDPAVVAGDAQRARNEFGYLRMWSIHPDQIRPIVKAFAPLASEVNDAGEILHAAQAAQWGPIEHKGRLHDRASYRYFWTVLQRAARAGLALPEQVRPLMETAA